MAVAGSERGICAVALPRPEVVVALETLETKACCARSELREVAPARFGTLTERIQAYIEGDAVEFPDVIDRSEWTPFRERVWNATMQIPYGQTRSYGWVAATVSQPRACRATGQALHRNPVPLIVPCHRVVGADGRLTGFGAGLELKQKLLSLEQDSAGA
ncbi:MAG: methylated-DNA--[protein]-cysteine S-methyltransferase [Dehalococcoidia bacterium]|nr:methylated-DNA--[protein]-cysteine S-methyltransferase [Dehalococcoidia bacterium]